MKFDSLWIKEGVHKLQLDKENEIRGLIKKYNPKFAINKLKL